MKNETDIHRAMQRIKDSEVMDIDGVRRVEVYFNHDVQIECDNCGEMFKRDTVNTTQNFCSRECKRKWMTKQRIKRKEKELESLRESL